MEKQNWETHICYITVWPHVDDISSEWEGGNHGNHAFSDGVSIVCAVGYTGDPGRVGDMGPQGFQGMQGPPGDIGDTGPNGTAGEQGQKGENGTKGMQGDVGEEGDLGPTGRRGPQGKLGGKKVCVCFDDVTSQLHVPGNISLFGNTFLIWSQQVQIYSNLSDLLTSEPSPAPGCVAFITNTQLLYVYVPPVWVPWVSTLIVSMPPSDLSLPPSPSSEGVRAMTMCVCMWWGELLWYSMATGTVDRLI